MDSKIAADLERQRMDLQRRLTSSGPERILVLHGGGVRATTTIGFLEEVGRLLRRHYGRPEFRLSDYSALTSGKSAEAALAAALAFGVQMSETRELALELAAGIFSMTKWARWKAIFDARPRKLIFHHILGDRALGKARIEAGLCIVTKRADTGSTWPQINRRSRLKSYRGKGDKSLLNALGGTLAIDESLIFQRDLCCTV